MGGRGSNPAWAASLVIAAALSAACVSADPALVAHAVDATLTAVPTTTPIVVVVTVIKESAVVASATPAPVSDVLTPSPTSVGQVATPTPEPTAEPAGGFIPTGAPTFADDFSGPGTWTLGEDAIQRTAIVDGRLAFTIKEADQFRFIYDSTRRASDFVAVVAGSAAACQFRDRYGLLFRVQDDANYYQFEIDCDGRYRLARVEQGALTPLKDWTADAAIHPGAGAANELGVRAQGQRIEVAVNGLPVFQAQDQAYAEGSFGLYAGANPASGFTVTFDDLRVWSLR